MRKRNHESGVSFYLGKGVRQQGELTFTGQAHLEGEFQGRIQGRGTVLIGPSAVVEAEIEATQVIISGHLTGNVKAGERIELKKPGHLTGDLSAPLVVMEEGVRFEGRCHMALDEKQEEAGRLELISRPG
ncbi:MAG: polymer-forming cytoskeletal protein [Desulfarculaceae bacterium]|nr:polymer-forming cytoskeletal protein [Desulfarculaceae bacterium]MCF8047820.1 polymer-forming cytoskeletal protein [Desulfarculaceae bacterium]MCF8066099.1 polymer-forming cytoskeletal protein [Desulfarculaceae bacterium]MCF8096876.1 polymer-forming cytoskeletal protein [Desulfarculaceae bacterium]MCF8121679.1 polymer-forming cytoskeletal protein [Desulfarculaceae bacterium]